MNNIHYIKAMCHQSSREQGFQFAPNEIKEKYDFEIKTNIFSGSEINSIKGHKLCKGYELLYKYILNYKTKNFDDKIITIGGDNSISAATVAAMNEKYMIQNGNTFSSDLKVLWIDCSPDLQTFTTSQTKDLHEMTVSSLFGLCNPTFAPSKLLLKPEQFIYFGLTDTTFVDDLGVDFYTNNKIKQIGIDSIIEHIKNSFELKPIHVVIDLKAFDKKLAPSVCPQNDNGLNYFDVIKLLKSIKDNIVAMDITEFNPLIGKNSDIKLTRDLAKKCITETFDIKEKSINIFNESSYFLIYRSTIKKTPDDYGWYILTGIEPNFKEELLKNIQEDSIITITLDNQEYLIAKTNINDQNNKSYYRTTKIADTTLFPNEKIRMTFELINYSYL